MTSHNVSFGGSGIPQTVLPAEDAVREDGLREALESNGDDRRTALAALAASAPRSISAWAALGDAGRDTMESYAYYRIGYHRGLDALRQNGWRGSGYVRWEHASNRPFLRCLAGLQRLAAEIGEDDEAERCALFLRQLEPTWPPAD
ncbi:MAG: hypothetical protein ACI81L_000048 [Verrucomicrobiales bacterium]|jgi:hypothetical protein